MEGNCSQLAAQLSARGVSRDVADLIFLSRRTKTNFNFNSTWQKWTQWCSSRAEDTFSASIASLLGFLAHQFILGRVYRSLNVYRSAVPSTHHPVEGFPLGQLPLVTRLLKGIFNSRPPKFKYSSVHNISQLTDYLQSLSDLLSFSLLTKRNLSCC